jgi:two-component system cell cycle response regulator DivK
MRKNMDNKVVEKVTAPRILIVEDNQDNRELIVKALTVDGEEAIEKAKSERPDLILMDLFIPKIDGYEVTRRLKGNDEFKNIPVIACTAHAMKGDMEDALAAGCDGYIPKPIDVRQLSNQINSFLHKEQ